MWPGRGPSPFQTVSHLSVTHSQQSARDDERGARSTTVEVLLHPIRNRGTTYRLCTSGGPHLPSPCRRCRTRPPIPVDGDLKIVRRGPCIDSETLSCLTSPEVRFYLTM